MKPPSGSTSSFTMVATSEERSRRNCGSGKRSRRVDELVAHAAQHPLAEPALEGRDVELEVAVDENEEQEQDAEIDEHRDAAELEARRRARPRRRRTASAAGRRRSAAPSRCRSGLEKPWPWIGPLTIALRQVEREEIERQRDHHDDQQPDLLALGMPPCIAEDILVHGAGRVLPRLRQRRRAVAEPTARNNYISTPARLSNARRQRRGVRRALRSAGGAAASRPRRLLAAARMPARNGRRRPRCIGGSPPRAGQQKGSGHSRGIGLAACADRVEIERPVGIGVGHGRHQRARIGMQRIAEQLARAARAPRAGRRTSRRCGRRCS